MRGLFLFLQESGSHLTASDSRAIGREISILTSFYHSIIVKGLSVFRSFKYWIQVVFSVTKGNTDQTIYI